MGSKLSLPNKRCRSGETVRRTFSRHHNRSNHDDLKKGAVIGDDQSSVATGATADSDDDDDDSMLGTTKKTVRFYHERFQTFSIFNFLISILKKKIESKL